MTRAPEDFIREEQESAPQSPSLAAFLAENLEERFEMIDDEGPMFFRDRAEKYFEMLIAEWTSKYGGGV